MADINPSAENVRAMLTKSNGRLRKASAEYFALLEKGLASSPLPAADQAKQFCDLCSEMSPQRSTSATDWFKPKTCRKRSRSSPSSSRTRCGR